MFSVHAALDNISASCVHLFIFVKGDDIDSLPGKDLCNVMNTQETQKLQWMKCRNTFREIFIVKLLEELEWHRGGETLPAMSNTEMKVLSSKSH